jgi:hypothetical protein
MLSAPSCSIAKSRFTPLWYALTLGTLWLLLHGYHGLKGDAQIYALQALARIHPQLSTDLYLQNTSQDRFTVVSPLYAWCINLIGLEHAARLLTILFTLWFLAAIWSFARVVTDRDGAWAAVAFTLIIGGYFGASDVFRILEPFFTARLPAEALISTALACVVRGKKRLGVSLALAALAIHPLMALPGVLLMGFLWLPNRSSILVAIGGVLATLIAAVIAVDLPAAREVLTIMDAPWLEVVRERSQFLFLQLWTMRDWETNAIPFACLGFTAIAVPDEQVRKLCAAAALVGAAGLAVAFIGSLIGPVAVLVQGQAWRWVWITLLVSAILTPFTAVRLWRDKTCGPICALLLACGWTLPPAEGTACVALAFCCWLARARISQRSAKILRWLSGALGLALFIWQVIKCWSLLSSPDQAAGATSVAIQLQDLYALKLPVTLLVALVWWWIRMNRSGWAPVLFSATFGAISVLLLPSAFKQSRTLASSAEIHEYAAWANAIPPTSTVLVAPPHDVGAFVWFTLERPNYLSLDQSAGVVFSRETALEVRRRSLNLLPLMDPDWKILSALLAESAGERDRAPATRPLTASKLMQVCADPQLGFVISPEKLGFDALPHEQAGTWRGWNLYDCRKVRSTPPPN